MTWTDPGTVQTDTLSVIADADNDTKMQVEESADDDIIRFDIGGTENFRMDDGRLEVLNTGGSVFIGENAGANDDGSDNRNIYIGEGSGENSTTAYYNTAIGFSSMGTITLGNLNTSVGNNALSNITEGSDNVALGVSALNDLTTGDRNVALGRVALQGLETGSGNVAIGYGAGTTSSGSGNVFIGNLAASFETGSNKLYIENTQSSAPLIYGEFDNDIVGINGQLGVGTQSPTDELHVEGSIRMVDGNEAAGYIPVADANGTMVWTDPGTVQTDTLSVIADADNDTKIQVEESADDDRIRFDIGGTEHFRMDNGRLEVLNTGRSVFIGESAGANDDGSFNRNVYVGHQAGENGFSAQYNTAVGHDAMRFITTGGFNTSIGAYALNKITGGENNVAVGVYSLDKLTTGDRNISLGRESLFSVVGGRKNVAIGYQAGRSTNGTGNIFIGDQAAMNLTGSNKLYIENSSSSSPLIYGEFDNDIVGINGKLGVGIQSPADELHVEGSIRMIDGNEAAGYIPVADANGTMVWTAPSAISGINELSDADNDTKMQVEESGDEDIIRFDVDGSQALTISSTANGRSRLFFTNANSGININGGFNLSSGSDNIILGTNAGTTLTTGSNNLFLGTRAGFTTNGSGNVFLGYEAGQLETGSNKLYLDNSSSSTPLIYGEFDNDLVGINGNLGVGTGAPDVTLHVSASSTGETTGIKLTQGVGNSVFYHNADNDLVIRKLSQADQLVLNDGGEVGVGTNAPNSKFHAVDNFTSAGTYVATVENTGNGEYANGLRIKAGQNTQSVNNRFISFVKPNGDEIGAVRQITSSSVDYNTTSDERLKTNITPTTKGLQDLMKIEVKDYVYKEDQDQPQTGFIAQQVYEHYPTAVSPGTDVKTNPWMMDYGKMTPLLVKAVQDLTKVVEEKNAENKALQEQVSELMQRMEQLEQQHKALKVLETTASQK